MIFTEVNTFYSVVSSAFKSLSLNKWRRDFLLEIFMLYLVIPGRINFTQMSRYSKSCEQRFRNQFKQTFDFMNYNAFLLNRFIEAFGIKPKALKSHHHVKELLYFGTKAA